MVGLSGIPLWTEQFEMGPTVNRRLSRGEYLEVPVGPGFLWLVCPGPNLSRGREVSVVGSLSDLLTPL